MTLSDYFTIAGFIVAITVALIGALPEIKRIRSKRKLDDTNSADVAFELAEKYGKKVLELEARITHTEEILGGELNLNMKIPMVELLRNGSASFTGTAHIVKKDEKTQPVQ